MLLSKKQTPKQLLGMYYAGVLNLFVSAANVYLYNITSGDAVSLICAIISVITAIVIFVAIKRKTDAMLWDKLKENSASTYDGTDTTMA